MGQRIIADKGVQVHPIGKSRRIGCEPTAEGRAIKPPAVIDEPGGCVTSLRRKAPGTQHGSCNLFLPKGTVSIRAWLFLVQRQEHAHVPLQIVDGSVDFSIEFEGDGGADFGVRSGAEDAELAGGERSVEGADFVLAVVEEVEGFKCVVLGGGLGEAAMEGVVGEGLGESGGFDANEAVEGVVGVGGVVVMDGIAVEVVREVGGDLVEGVDLIMLGVFLEAVVESVVGVNVREEAGFGGELVEIVVGVNG